MNVYEGTIKDCKIAYIGGGSRGWAWRLMADLAMEPALSGKISLYDIDKPAARYNEIIGNRLSARTDVTGKWDYEVADGMEEALTGADFVILSILPGTLEEMHFDVHQPEEYGIWQSVGDTVGPGGIVRALRTIPMYVEIARGIKAYAPNAWVINYTNPMSLCIKTLYHVFPQIKAFGCCHEVFGTQKMLANILQDEQAITGVKRSEIMVNVVGINHFTWFTEASYKGIDLFPVYRKYVDSHYQTGYKKGDDSWLNQAFSSGQRVKFDLFLKYGFIAAAGDRHLAEFMPGDEYLKDPETVKEWMFSLTTVDSRKDQWKERLERSGRLVRGEEEIELKPSGEEGVMLIKALCGLTRWISNVNIPNTGGQIPNLSKETVVETNAVFSKDHIRPVLAGEIPESILSLVLPHAENQEVILNAAMNCDFEAALSALMNDPNAKAKIEKNQAHELLTQMLTHTAAFLPEQWNDVLARRNK
ncbi:alpha-glucosidase/alpha-galactosidase [Clostridium sp. HBUAS56010]|uniref:family 4 glycosyl hydrolase n=1 Tax=Clostridium sp. HBUAS56010 TaxID=2571127 RepID=UPI0011783737|nr:alpha-glucosidase/alpha-galactosidase [Clostridium sp. HBUAS56010]